MFHLSNLLKMINTRTKIHLGLVPCLCLSAGAVGNVFILGLDLSNNGIHVQVAAIVHLYNDRSVLDLALELTQFLKQSINKRVQSVSHDSAD